MDTSSHALPPLASLLSLNVTFVEADPARHSWFALWDPNAPGGLLESGPEHDLGNGSGGGAGSGLASESLTLHLPARRGVTPTDVSVRRLDLTTAIDLLGTLRHDQPASPSARAWAAVVRAALSFVAEGRVLPWVSPAGFDTWRADPLGPQHTALVTQLAEALPAAAHATPVQRGPGSTTRQTKLISDPVYAVRSACDAVVDRFLRTPAAHRVGSLSLFANPEPTRADHLRPWVEDIAADQCAASRLALRVHPPDDIGDEAFTDGGSIAETAGRWRVRFELISTVDPSLVVDAADYWTAPAEVMARLGDRAEVTLLAGLRTLGRLVPPLEPVLEETAPVEAHLADDDLDLLLDALDDLAEHKIDVRWPAELVAPSIERRVVVGAGPAAGATAEPASAAAPGDDMASVLDLRSLLAVDWEFLLDGIPLTAAELEVLGEAKRAVVPLRGKWVRLGAAERERLRARAPRLTMGDVLAASLGDGQLDLGQGHGLGLGLGLGLGDGSDSPGDGSDGSDGGDDNERVSIRVDGALGDLLSRLSAVTGGREEIEPPGLQAELRPYQRRGLAWMADLCQLGLGGCLADDMGLGKTLQVLALQAHRQQLADVDPAPTLVVCPTSLLANWEREAARFVPDIPVRVYHGPNRSLEGLKPDELVVTSYGVVRGDTGDDGPLTNVRFGLAVADEAQQAKNPRSGTARALRRLNAGSRIALTGTPVENRLSELWSILDWVVPGLLGPLATFRRTTAAPIERDGDEAATARLARLVAPFLLRRRKTDPGIAPELPDKIERDVIVALSPEQATLYKATVTEALAEIEELASATGLDESAPTEGSGGSGAPGSGGMQRRGMVLALLTKLKQITNHPALFLAEGVDGLQAGRSGKLDALDELLASTGGPAGSAVDGAADVDADNGTLIFTQYVGMGRLLVQHLAAQGYRTGLLHGGLSTKARQELVDGFQARALDVLVLSLKAGGTGLNLTAATHVVHYDRWWNPAVEDQATDRAYRIGQDRTVTVHRFMAQGTVEDRVAELLARKRELADRVFGSGGEAWISELDDAELAELVTLAPTTESAYEPAAKTSAEPADEPTTEPADEPPTEPADEPTGGPADVAGTNSDQGRRRGHLTLIPGGRS